MTNNEFSESNIDLLKEIGNIGAGNAATALSTMIQKKVEIEVPVAKICNLTDIPDILGGPESIKTACLTNIFNSLNGYILFVLDSNDAEELCKIISQGYDIDSQSVLTETSNIITGSYIGAIGNMIGEIIDQSPPQVGCDMIGALIDAVIADLLTAADSSVVIGTKLIIENKSISGFFMMLLENDSLNFLLNKFNTTS